MPTRQGSFRIFTLAGIGVYVHWLWLLVAVFSFQYRTHEYTSQVWNAAEYLSLFLIVLIHEFGHQLACRSVGGQTHDIVLWPLGGVAYVSPPQRPGAQLWSIAAGPLVNVILVPVLSGLVALSSHIGWADSQPDAYDFIHNLWWINMGLLIFNLLPVYPLDGGQILRSLLWFPFGRANSLLVASFLGFVGVAGLIGLALWMESLWTGIMAAFIGMNCWRGFKQARALARLAKLPRREGFVCPACQTAPPLGERWRCGKCGQPFDAFLTPGICPHCAAQYNSTQCLDCGSSNPFNRWSVLEARWLDLVSKKNWAGALEVADSEIVSMPNSPSGWVHQAYALRRIKGVDEAWDALLPAAEKFPNAPGITYNLACYACQRMDLDGARAWLIRAMEKGGREAIKKKAVKDDDLKPLWSEIERL